MDDRVRLAKNIDDDTIIHSFYLDMKTKDVLAKIDSLSICIAEVQKDIPFNAEVKGYIGAVDADGEPWILKPALSREEALYHRICTLAFLLDHWMGTLSAPTTVCTIKGKKYRAVKVVRNSIQISSYNYMDRPFIEWLRMDLINRWLYFDEDRNPNNYLVIRNNKEKPFMVAIDFDKADFETTSMKISGTEDKFGWRRTGKTRFLTLLRPENFEGVSIESFDSRLKAMMAIPKDGIEDLARRLVNGYCDNVDMLAATLTANIESRRHYIDEYFRKMFKLQSETKNTSNSDDYSMFGASFLSTYGDNK
ncbi:MAG: hypothetical protein ABIJ86_05060 [Spirochaetota bacterium]